MEQREIKFRAWMPHLKRMFKPETLLVIQGILSKLPKVETLGCIYMQYTGLTDKNGKEIFEADVVEWIDNRINKTKPVMDKILFNNGAFFVDDILLSEACEDIKVIGNIYENPELLK